MNRARWKEIDEQFRQAIELPEAARTRFVRELLVRNPELGLAVKDLLESAAEAEAVLGESAAVFAGPMLAGLTDEEWDALHPGAIVGGYRLLREIGRAGRSTVYLAEPANAKFADARGHPGADAGRRRGRDHRAPRARAGSPRAARASRASPASMMAGPPASGLPYLVIELVDGRPLLAWCDERRVDVTARLEIFLQVCAAVQHAHQHFVAHSDLTASRVLMLDQGTAKIMEFGTARVLHAGAVTTADDVRALGVILHQLLTGRVPPSAAHQRERGGDRGWREREPRPRYLTIQTCGQAAGRHRRHPVAGAGAGSGTPLSVGRRTRRRHRPAPEAPPGSCTTGIGGVSRGAVRAAPPRAPWDRRARGARAGVRGRDDGFPALARGLPAGATVDAGGRGHEASGHAPRRAVARAVDVPPGRVQPPAEPPQIETRGADRPNVQAPKAGVAVPSTSSRSFTFLPQRGRRRHGVRQPTPRRCSASSRAGCGTRGRTPRQKRPCDRRSC